MQYKTIHGTNRRYRGTGLVSLCSYHSLPKEQAAEIEKIGESEEMDLFAAKVQDIAFLWNYRWQVMDGSLRVIVAYSNPINNSLIIARCSRFSRFAYKNANYTYCSW